jgi:hypothetical protein
MKVQDVKTVMPQMYQEQQCGRCVLLPFLTKDCCKHVQLDHPWPLTGGDRQETVIEEGHPIVVCLNGVVLGRFITCRRGQLAISQASGCA